nr:diguanylate cyclase [Pyrinomonadaceae bacterium]
MRLTASNSTVIVEAGGERGRLRAVWAWLVIAVALLLIAWLDNLTATPPVQHLYYLPIIYAATRFKRAGGVPVALLAVLLYHLTDPSLMRWQYAEADIVQISLFLIVGVVTAKMINDAEQLRVLASTDDLTGLYNLRSFEMHLARMVRQARYTSAPISLLVLDLDRLKTLNDTHGHLAGAEAVRTVGHTIACSLPTAAVACRYGDDEFVIALPRATPAYAAVAEELATEVRRLAPTLDGREFPKGSLSVSIGVASRTFSKNMRDDVTEGELLFQAADRALYS